MRNAFRLIEFTNKRKVKKLDIGSKKPTKSKERHRLKLELKAKSEADETGLPLCYRTK